MVRTAASIRNSVNFQTLKNKHPLIGSWVIGGESAGILRARVRDSHHHQQEQIYSPLYRVLIRMTVARPVPGQDCLWE